MAKVSRYWYQETAEHCNIDDLLCHADHYQLCYNAPDHAKKKSPEQQSWTRFRCDDDPSQRQTRWDRETPFGDVKRICSHWHFALKYVQWSGSDHFIANVIKGTDVTLGSGDAMSGEVEDGANGTNGDANLADIQSVELNVRYSLIDGYWWRMIPDSFCLCVFWLELVHLPSLFWSKKGQTVLRIE